MIAVSIRCPAQSRELAELAEVPRLIAGQVREAGVVYDSWLSGCHLHMAMGALNRQLAHTPNVESPSLNGNTATDLAGESIQRAMYGHPPWA